MKINKIEAAILAQAVGVAMKEIVYYLDLEGLESALIALEDKLAAEAVDARRQQNGKVIIMDFSDVCKVFTDAHIAKTTKSE